MLVGLVGKPSAGKSTFFRAATLAEVEIANYPFTTIKPNSGVGYVKIDCIDKFFNKQCNPRTGFCISHKRFVPIQLIDVAGLVPGAHAGRGRGNQFLDDLRQANVLIHVIDVSGSINENGEPVETGSYDPAKDVCFLEFEIDMWYYDILSKGWEKFARTTMQEKQQINKALAKQLSGFGVTEDMVGSAVKKTKVKEDFMRWDQEDLKILATELRKRTKPMIIAANKIDIPGAKENYDRLVKLFPDYKFVPCSAESEIALREAARKEIISYAAGEKDFTILKEDALNEQQKKALKFVKENVLDAYGSTGIQDVLDYAVFKLLGYVTVFPGGVNKLEDQYGNVLPDCFLMPPGSTALDFAFKLHSDFGNNFVKAIDVKTKKIIGREYVLSMGDVVEIVSRK